MTKFKKITAVVTSVLMAGMTAGMAAAASWTDFAKANGADTAVVYGASASMDLTAATSVQSALADYAKTTKKTTVEGGEAFTLEKNSDKFNFGDSLNFYGSLDDEDLSALADGTYDDGSIDEDFTQKITLADHTLKQFKDEDVNDEEPTIGFEIADNQAILTYTMDFDGSDVEFSKMSTTDMPLLGADYYVKTATTDSIELLDTAEENVLALNEEATIAGKTVKVEYIGDNKVKFSIDGKITDSLEENEEYELDDGSYVIPTDIMTSSKDSVADSVEFSIGSGKITLHNDGNEVELNDDDVDGLFASYDKSGDVLNSLTLTWKADEDTFLYEGKTLEMPLFEKIKVAFNGLNFPTESETVKFAKGDTLKIEMDNYDLPVMYVNDDGSAVNFGEEHHELVTALENVTYKDAGIIETENNTVLYKNVLPVKEDQRFVVTKIEDDLSDIETLYYEIDSIKADDEDTVLKLSDKINDKDLDFDEINDDKDNGDVNVELVGFNSAKDTAYLTFKDATDYNKIVSDKGLVITLPSATSLTEDMAFDVQEANEDGDVAQGEHFTVNVKLNEDKDVLYVRDHTVTDLESEKSDDLYTGYMPSELASKTTLDKSGDENDFEVEYYGKEVSADTQVIMGGEVSTSTTEAGKILVTDKEIESVKDKNLVIVGGSCINSAAATVLGSAMCGDDFSAKTGVKAGEFLIQGAQDAFTEGKLAVVVAGYAADDTANGVKFLMNKDADVTKTYKGTSATEATLVTKAN